MGDQSDWAGGQASLPRAFLPQGLGGSKVEIVTVAVAP